MARCHVNSYPDLATPATINPPPHTTPSNARKRPWNESRWKKRVAKRERNLGHEYTSVNTGKENAARGVGPPCNCSINCFDLVGHANIESIFRDFWASGSWNTQTAYIQKQTTTVAVKRRRTNNVENQKGCTRYYHVTVDDTDITVCKTAFANIHGISRQRLDRAQKNKTSSGVLIPDRRGTTGSHGKILAERREKAINHIQSFPTITSHYSRKSSPNARYLHTDVVTKRQMYDLYKVWLEENHPREVPCSWHYYDDILKSHFPHLKLYKPRQDTCKTCDIYNVRSKDPTLTREEKTANERKHSLHLEKAETGYNLPNTLLISNNSNTVMILCMDLQQALPTPKVSTGISFYKRKMWTYNFNIHDYRRGKAHLFVWDEVTAKRGANEICSCINKFINTFVPPEVEKLFIFSDNCSGQNKNFILLMFYLSLIHTERFKEITHIYFIPGHTYMAADRDFAMIEKNMMRHSYIFTPDEHIEIIKNTKKTGENPFEVVKMQQEDFKDYNSLKQYVTRRNPTHVRFIDACYFRVSHTNKSGYLCDNTYTTLREGGGEQVRVGKGSDPRADETLNLSQYNVPRKYERLIPLSKPKLNDLKVLVGDLVPPYIRRRYWDAILEMAPEQNGRHGADDSEADGLDFRPDTDCEFESERCFYDYE